MNTENNIITVFKKFPFLNDVDVSFLNTISFYEEGTPKKDSFVYSGTAYFDKKDTEALEHKFSRKFDVDINLVKHKSTNLAELVRFIDLKLEEKEMENKKTKISSKELDFTVEAKDNSFLTINKWFIGTAEKEGISTNFKMTRKRWKSFDKWFKKNRKQLLKKEKKSKKNELKVAA